MFWGLNFMLAQFRSLYPTGQLISELVTIHHGRFVVRSLVLLDGKTIATGLSAADTVEGAEDAARLRALALLDLKATTPAFSAPETPMPLPAPAPLSTPSPAPDLPLSTPTFTPSPQSSFVTAGVSASEMSYTPAPEVRPSVSAAPSFSPPPKQLESDAWLSSSYTGIEKEPELSPVLSETELKPVAAPLESLSEPADSSDVIAKTDVELKRLKWTTKQGRDYLQQAYGKLSRHLLTEEELLDFLQYLESLPNP